MAKSHPDSSTPGLGAEFDDGPDALATAEECANFIINGNDDGSSAVHVLQA